MCISVLKFSCRLTLVVVVCRFSCALATFNVTFHIKSIEAKWLYVSATFYACLPVHVECILWERLVRFKTITIWRSSEMHAYTAMDEEESENVDVFATKNATVKPTLHCWIAMLTEYAMMIGLVSNKRK